MITASEAIFAVADVTAAVNFYRDVLGFESQWLWGTPVTFGGVGIGKVHLMFCLQPEIAARVAGHQHFFKVENVDEWHARHVAAGATIVEPIGNRPWGLREYTVADLNGYHLRFAGPIEYARPEAGTDVLPEFVRVEIRTPTAVDFAGLVAAVGWNKKEETIAAALANSLFCVAATDTRYGRVIGMLRVTGDGRHFMIWDVMVMPENQGQKIGSAMMQLAMKHLRTIGPKGAFVGLFTGKPKFYERVGFSHCAGMQATL